MPTGGSAGGSGVSESAGPLLPARPSLPLSGREPQRSSQVAASPEPAKLSLPFNHSSPAGRGTCGLGRKGLMNKVETGVVTFTSCLSTSCPSPPAL